jgi:hypothetical protein
MKNLGENISNHVCCRNMLQLDDLSIHLFPDPVIFNSNVLGSFVMNRLIALLLSMKRVVGAAVGDNLF